MTHRDSGPPPPGGESSRSPLLRSLLLGGGLLGLYLLWAASASTPGGPGRSVVPAPGGDAVVLWHESPYYRGFESSFRPGPPRNPLRVLQALEWLEGDRTTALPSATRQGVTEGLEHLEGLLREEQALRWKLFEVLGPEGDEAVQAAIDDRRADPARWPEGAEVRAWVRIMLLEEAPAEAPSVPSPEPSSWSEELRVLSLALAGMAEAAPRVSSARRVLWAGLLARDAQVRDRISSATRDLWARLGPLRQELALERMEDDPFPPAPESAGLDLVRACREALAASR